MGAEAGDTAYRAGYVPLWDGRGAFGRRWLNPYLDRVSRELGRRISPIAPSAFPTRAEPDRRFRSSFTIFSVGAEVS